MKNIFILLSCLIILLSGCDKEKPVIFFSREPFNLSFMKYNNFKTLFQEGDRVYFFLYNPKPFGSNMMRLQILKLDRKAPFFGISLAMSRDVEIDKSLNYYTDYFCLHKQGSYVLRIFSMDRLDKPVSQAEFEVIAP